MKNFMFLLFLFFFVDFLLFFFEFFVLKKNERTKCVIKYNRGRFCRFWPAYDESFFGWLFDGKLKFFIHVMMNRSNNCHGQWFRVDFPQWSKKEVKNAQSGKTTYVVFWRYSQIKH